LYATDELRRRIKDLFYEAHPAIEIPPKKAIRVVDQSLLKMDAAERAKTLDQLRQGAVAYYEGRHRERIPLEIEQKLTKLESEIARMNRVDWATKKLEEYGGPPTRFTVQESIRRSLDRKREQTPPFDPDPPHPKTVREHAPILQKPAGQAPQKLRSHDSQKQPQKQHQKELIQEP
jgi:hypothetical protein